MKLQIRLECTTFPKVLVQVNGQLDDVQQQTNSTQLGQVDRPNETASSHDRTNLVELEVLMRPA